MPIILKFFQKLEKERTRPNSFCKVNITPIQKPNKDATRKESLRPISLMNLVSKVFHKLLVNWFNSIFKRIIHHNQMGFIPGMQEWSNTCKSINMIHQNNGIKDKKSTQSSQQMQRKHFTVSKMLLWKNILVI